MQFQLDAEVVDHRGGVALERRDLALDALLGRAELVFRRRLGRGRAAVRRLLLRARYSLDRRALFIRAGAKQLARLGCFLLAIPDHQRRIFAGGGDLQILGGLEVGIFGGVYLFVIL